MTDQSIFLSASKPRCDGDAATRRALDDLRRVGRLRPAELLFWGAALASFLVLPGSHLLLSQTAILGLFALSLDLIIGYAGIVSLGHGAFFGLGAYTAGIVSVRLTEEPLSGLVLGGLVAALAGALTGPLLTLRATDLSRLMVTLGIATLLHEGANQLTWLTGGADGLSGVTVAPIFGLFEFDLIGTTGYGYCLAVSFALFLAARRVVTSPYGLSLRAIRDNALRARAMGIPVAARLVGIYAFSAFIAGVAGALLTQVTMFTSLDVLGFERSADVLLVLVLGGVGYLYGGLIGAVIFTVLQDRLATLSPQYWQFWIGLILVVIVLIGRDRLAAVPVRLRAGLSGRKAAAGEGEA